MGKEKRKKNVRSVQKKKRPLTGKKQPGRLEKQKKTIQKGRLFASTKGDAVVDRRKPRRGTAGKGKKRDWPWIEKVKR